MGDENARVIDIAEPDGKPNVDGDPAANNGTAKPNRTTEKLNGYPAAEPATIKVNKNGNRTGLHNRTDRTRGPKGQFLPGPISARDETPPVPKVVAVDKLSVTELLFSIHLMLAALTGIPEFELDKDEARKLGDAGKELGKYYVPEINPKWVAFANLGAVAGFIYGPRAVAYRTRRNAEKERKPKAGPVLVDVAKPQPEAPPAPAPEAKVNGTAAARNRQMAPSELWPEPAGDWPGLG